jgi:hypothetical protein
VLGLNYTPVGFLHLSLLITLVSLLTKLLGWSPDITPAKNGCYVIPWGRVGTYKKTLQQAAKSKADGGNGASEKLWEACEKVVKPYL